MKVSGIVVEYNPFHNGHKYHIEQTRKITGSDYVIAVMSGDYTQRGVPAITDKYLRTQMALLNGVDLVLELPLYYSVGSAEYFSMGAVSLMDKLGIVDSLCFGSECGNIETLSNIASVLIEEPPVYRSILQDELKKGLSYPKARSSALSDFFSDSPECVQALSTPNNILGIEYMKALIKRNSSIRPYTMKRQGAGYHDALLVPEASDSPKSSASAIRLSVDTPEGLMSIKNHVPENVYHLLHNYYHKEFPIRSDDFSLLLKYKLLLDSTEGYDQYIDIHPDLSDKIKKCLNDYHSYEQFCEILKSKDLTYSRISRGLIHILLNLNNNDLAKYTENDYIGYARILGFRKESAKLLRAIKDNASIPLISKLADASLALSPEYNTMLEKDILASNIYASVISAKYGVPYVNEFSKQLVIIP